MGAKGIRDMRVSMVGGGGRLGERGRESRLERLL
jgi:hypothetical protein